MDKSSFSGILIALSGIVAGMMLEGGKIGQILQPTAAMIVFGGTLGAVMVTVPACDCRIGAEKSRQGFRQ